MALVYFDASALVKLIVEEDGSDLATDLWDGCDAPVSSRLAYPEVRAALAAAQRNHSIEPADVAAVGRAFEDYWASVRTIELSRSVEQHAGQLAGLYGLHGADAVHLASALALEEGTLVFAVWDRRLHRAAESIGLRCAPQDLRGGP
jgi:predicted nucleic acid-binding protein